MLFCNLYLAYCVPSSLRARALCAAPLDVYLLGLLEELYASGLSKLLPLPVGLLLCLGLHPTVQLRPQL